MTDFDQPSDSHSKPGGEGCPDRAALERLARGDATATETRRLERHLATCGDCLHAFLDWCDSPTAPRIPGIRVVREIGRGRFGVVYKAWSLTPRPCLVALKILTVAGNMEVHRFDREIAVLRRIESPRVVKCLDAGVTGDAHYFVMDYVDGTHLDEYLLHRAEGLHEKLAVFRRVCQAVADAHAHGVVHRDLKPRNILVDDAGEPHVLDFGICSIHRDIESTLSSDTLTRHGDVIGTLKYMSPEQAWGGVAGPIDARSDVWSLGIILFEIVTGGYPYSLAGTSDRPPHEALLDRIRKQLPQRPRVDHVPDGRKLAVLIERCLTWDPENRITSVSTLADDIGNYLNARRIKTRPLGPFYRIKRLAVGAAMTSRWTFATAFVAATCALLWCVAFMCNVGWQVSGIVRNENPLVSSAGAMARDSADNFVIVGIRDESVAEVQAFAEDSGWGAVTDSVRTWRGIHAYLLDRLRDAQPLAVAWDYFFKSPQPEDERLIAAVQALERDGIPVTLAARRYGSDGVPDLSPAIREGLGRTLRHGVITARDMVARPGEFVIAVQLSPEITVPSLALVTAAAAMHPGSFVDIRWGGRFKPVRLMYEFEPGAYLGGVDDIEPTKVFQPTGPQDALRPTDLVATVAVDLHPPAFWEARTAAYEELLTCDPGTLRSIVQGKIVIFGDLRHRSVNLQPDRHPVRYGAKIANSVPGCYLQADAIRGILQGRVQHASFPPAAGLFLALLLVSLLGCVLPIRLAGANLMTVLRWRRTTWTAVALLAAASLWLMVGADQYGFVVTGMIGVSLLIPLAGCLWVELARNRHRILDHQRQLIEGFGLDSAGTITVTPTRR